MSISPRVDIAFKKIFGVEENKDLLISLINAIVSEEDQVSDLALLNPYNPRHFRNDKLSILDIKARGKEGKKFNIEIQLADEANYDKRALYYWAKLYTEQLEKSSAYYKLAKTVGIHILNFTSIVGVSKYHNTFHITEKETGVPFFKDLELHTIELKKFTGAASEEIQQLASKVNTALDRWAAFLTRHDLLNKDNLPKKLNDKALKKALHVLEVMNFTSQERSSYEEHLKWLRMEESALEKVRRDSIEIGKTQGIEIGKMQVIEKLVITMLTKQIDRQLISQITGFTFEQIKHVQERIYDKRVGQPRVAFSNAITEYRVRK